MMAALFPAIESQTDMDGIRGPLDGIRIIDLTRVLAGPYATMVLADLGAEVWKVETPDGGDDARGIGPFLDRTDGGPASAYFASLNRGKYGIALDLKADDDRALFERMLGHADILVENFRPGTMDRLGYGADKLASRFPSLVLASVSGFGQTGPYAGRAAYDMVVQAMGGIMSVTGMPGGPPVRVGTSIGDIAAGLFTAIGILAALHERGRSGRGRHVDVAMLDCQIAILENAISRFFASGVAPGPLGARHPSITPFAAYRTADGFIVIAAGNDQLFARLADCLGRPHWTNDPRFGDNDRRTAHAEDLEAEIEAVLSGHGTAHWLAQLGEAGIPCGPINDIAAALADPQVSARNMTITAGESAAGPVRMAGNPIKISDLSDPATRRPAPALDADRALILERLAALEAAAQ